MTRMTVLNIYCAPNSITSDSVGLAAEPDAR